MKGDGSMYIYCPICGGSLGALEYTDNGIICEHCGGEFWEGDLEIEDPRLDEFLANIR